MLQKSLQNSQDSVLKAGNGVHICENERIVDIRIQICINKKNLEVTKIKKKNKTKNVKL